MSSLLCFQVLILALTTTLPIWAYPDGTRSECLGNLLRVSVDGYLTAGELAQAKVYVLNGSDVIGPITPFLAAKCGFSMVSDPWGNTRLYVSLQHCYTQSKSDGTFEINLQLRPHGEDSHRVHTVSKSCSYPKWTSREILCSQNYMEVSVEHNLPTSEQLAWMVSGVKDATPVKSVSAGTRSPFRLLKVIVYAPAQKEVTPVELHTLGYGLYTSPTRLLIRGLHNTSVTYSQDVAGVPMAVMRSSVVYEHRWMLFLVNASAACPTGGVSFTEEMITWRLPRHITPLLSSASSETLQAYMGIEGQRLDEASMVAKGYSLYATDSHIVIEMPIGSPDGYYKSHVHKRDYQTTFTIEPMVELLWRASGGSETRYKVLYPITTPPVPRPPHVIDYTVPEEGVFKMVLGTFLPDVELTNITIDSAEMTVLEAAANGFDIRQHGFPNGSKAFSLEVPFTHPAVIKEIPNVKTMTYTLDLVFVFLVLPEETMFFHPAVLETSVKDTDLASVTGSCDQRNVYITVKYGSQGPNFETLVGGSLLTGELAQQYSFKENVTHFSLVVPFGSPDIAIEGVQSSFVRGRLDVTLQNPEKGWNITYFSLACSFLTSVIECSPNGTIRALAVKLEAVPRLDPRQLTLNDPSCGPYYSDDRFAFFYFRVDSCGTIRKFKDDVMVYENKATLKSAQNTMTQLNLSEPVYRFRFFCIYAVNAGKTVAFSTMPQSTTPVAEAGVGELMVHMRLAKDMKYTDFFSDGDYPVVRYLRQPLYFEVELVKFKDPNVELVIDRCWAALNEDRMSKPRWDVIVDGCPNPEDPDQTIFHPVRPDDRVVFPSLFKRLEVKMFSFAEAEDTPAGQVVFHCDAVICDPSSPLDGLCHGQCANKQMGTNSVKRGPRAVSQLHIEHVSSGLLFLI
ncbi:uncharacterized protein LOC121711898 [Alosa sapidissima]|uniref:uncharacterized protein LOC121711898 n=1 Tax=Alosa sapidissima TaxID=34773 RepID=UPI001C09B16E|nr:uncharacterized protein LOC121711898 [Alosa sapidissima]